MRNSTDKAMAQGSPAALPSARPLSPADSEQLTAEHQDLLRLQVEARVTEFEHTLAEDDGGERGREITSAIQSAQDYLRVSRERVGGPQAAQLSKWLAKTEDLRVTSPGMPIIKQP